MALAIIAQTFKCNETLLRKFFTFCFVKKHHSTNPDSKFNDAKRFFRTRCPQVAAPLLSEPVFSCEQYFSRSMCSWCTQRLSPIGKVTCIRQMREPRCEMPWGHFCHSSCSRATLSWLNNGSARKIPQTWSIKDADISSTCRSWNKASNRYTICLSYLVVHKDVRLCNSVYECCKIRNELPLYL